VSRTLFITGTDTGVGKTHVTCAVLTALRARGTRACGFKPVSAGCERTPQGLRNDDALALQAAAGTALDYADLNPCAFEPAIAPHLAAAQAGVTIDTRVLDAAHARLAAQFELVLAEGAGGWLVPLGERATFADWVSARRWPVLLVVGMRLGCLNHALLSAESIASRVPLLGWVASVLPPEMPELAANIEALQLRLPAPLLGVVRGAVGADAVAGRLLARVP
jgi:dethiobiotin synthetase